MRIISRRPMAVARIKGGREVPLLKGEVRFYQYPGGVLVEADVSGLPDNGAGFYGFHIHTGSACAGGDFSETGGHYDPAGRLHPQHAGDLPPLLSYGSRAYLAVMTDRFSLADVIGRTVVIHAMPDDFHSQPAGDAGMKIGCGTIERIAKKRT